MTGIRQTMILAFGAFELDAKRRVLRCQGEPVELLSRPFDILAFLIEARDRVVSREEMQSRIWPGQILTANNLNVQISMLRRVLAKHDPSEMIITVPGRGYRFIGEVVAIEAPAAEDAAPSRARWRHLAAALVGRRSPAVVATLALAAVAAAAITAPWPHARFAVHVQVETVPDTVTMVSGGYCKVDYVFHVLDPTDLQLATEDVSFHLTSGEIIGQAAVGGRIYHGSFPISGGGSGVYHNNIWLPPDVAASVRASNRDELYLRHSFHLSDPFGREIVVPAVLKIVFGPSEQACAVPAGR